MPDIKLYDYQKIVHPQVKSAMYYFVPEQKTSASLHPTAPWLKGNMFCCYYDEQDKLIGVRFVYADGTYKNLIGLKKEAPSKQKLITQKATERALHALELRKKGWTYKAVGIAMNVSASRARDLANKGERILNRRNHESIST